MATPTKRDVVESKIAADLPGSQEARQALSKERSFQRLVDSVVDYAIFQLDERGMVATWNAGAQRIKGYAPEEIIGRHFSCFYTEEDRREGLPQMVLETAIKEGRFEAESWRVRKDGSRFFASVVIDAIFDDEGKVVGFAKVTRDVTERLKAQIALKEAQEQLAVAQKMESIGQLSGGIAHDFNNLMMIVQGNIESAIRHAADNPNLQRYLRNAMRGAQRAAALTTRLLAFARRQPLDPKPIDLNKFLVGAVDFIQRSIGEQVQVESVGLAGLWLVDVDANQLEAALINLALNARDAMSEGGKLTIEVSNTYLDAQYCRTNPEVSPGQFVVLSVSDTGEGMSSDVRNRAFEPFFTTKEPGQGTGLGLSQVYGFVKQSGGHVKLYSELGKGTTFKIYFPRLRAKEIEEEAPEEQPLESQGETVLVVEDDDDVRSYIVESLRELNYRVLPAANAESALRHVENGALRIDLMLTDVVMPGMNGHQLAQKAAEHRPELKIIYMSGYSQNAIIHGGRLDADVVLLVKPVNQTTLATRIRELLDLGRG
jgi:PAS domain S-box-containing protein